MIIMLAGLPGTGKTTLARALAAATGGIVLNKDDVRATLFPGDAIEYTTEQDDFVMHVILRAAAFVLSKQPERMIFLDGRPFARRYQIDQVLTAARAMNQEIRILLCSCSEETAQERLRRQERHPAANRNFALYERIKAEFEPIAVPHAEIDTDQPEEVCVSQALATLQANS
jgi:adenylylsulfate kinase